MHNSNNSAVGKVIFTGTQLAQAKLLGISADTNNPNPNNLQEQIEADTQAKVSVYPRFSEAKAQNGDVPVEIQSYIQAALFGRVEECCQEWIKKLNY